MSSRGGRWLEVIFLVGMCFLIEVSRELLKRAQSSSTDLLMWSGLLKQNESVVRDSMSSVSAREWRKTVRGGLLMRFGLVSIIVRTAEWSLIPGMVAEVTILLGRVVKKRSRILSYLVGSVRQLLLTI